METSRGERTRRGRSGRRRRTEERGRRRVRSGPPPKKKSRRPFERHRRSSCKLRLNIPWPGWWREPGRGDRGTSNRGCDTFVTDVSRRIGRVSIFCSICHRRLVLSCVHSEEEEEEEEEDEFVATWPLSCLPTPLATNSRPVPWFFRPFFCLVARLVIPADAPPVSYINFTGEHWWMSRFRANQERRPSFGAIRGQRNRQCQSRLSLSLRTRETSIFIFNFIYLYRRTKMSLIQRKL